ncbi:MAG: ActD-like protein [Deltaproteobacteria bacterium]|nr:MAG: ActD-like protein [Deltaproteobacteria bacterium]TMQ23365.1 MAG: ActD-like protein [Deltaproteobacteria bacterium]
MAALREDNAAELARYPAAPAVAQIEARVAQARQARRRRRRRSWLGLAMSAAAVVVVVGLAALRPAADVARGAQDAPEETRVKGSPRLLAFRQVGEQVERLAQDAVVHAGDVIQLRYKAGGQGYGVIASIDGAGGVTLHYPLHDDAPPQATVMPAETAALPHAWALDDAPRFERFFFVTANDPVDVQRTLAALHALARRGDSATGSLELPSGLQQWSLRLRKADRPSTHESP